MTFEAIYGSPWHNPGATLVSLTLVLWLLSRKLPFFTAWSVLFLCEITLDALLTGEISPWRNTATVGYVAIPFVILGDARYFMLVERFTRAPDPAAPTPPRALVIALAQSLPVPALSIGLTKLLPHLLPDARSLFLVYEVEFLLVALAWRFWYLPPRLAKVPADTARWLRELTAFEAVQYLLWAAADVVILLHHDAGFALRIVPNVMYYGLFLPFALMRAPRELRP